MLRDRSLIPLSHQHHNGLALCVLIERSLKADTSEANIARLTQRIRDRFELEMANHFDLEEKYLFPLLRELPMVDELIADHRTIESMVAGMLDEAAIRAFVDLLRKHIRREENELFEQAQRLLPRDTLDELGRVLEQHAVRICLD